MERTAQPVERQHDGQETAARRRGLQPHLAASTGSASTGSASTGSACTSSIPEPSHVLRALGLTPAQSDASIRFSFGRFTTDAEVHQAASLIINHLPPPHHITPPHLKTNESKMITEPICCE